MDTVAAVSLRSAPTAPQVPAPRTSAETLGSPPPEASGHQPPRGPALALAGLAVSLSFAVLGTSALRWSGTGTRVIDLGEVGIGLLYLVVGVLAAGFLRRYRVHLHWTRGPVLASALVGLAAGGAAGLLVALRSQVVSGHVVVDPAIAQQLSEATAGRVAFGLLVPVVVAPLVEEVVFRGILTESMLGRGLLRAAAVSAPAFWLWHWRLSPEAFVYLGTFGLLTAAVYRYRGLAASVLAHATFNAILVAIVLVQLAAPARTVHSADGVALRVPASWTSVRATDGFDLALSGPSGAQLGELAQQASGPSSVADLTASVRARASALVGGAVAGDVHPISLAAGPAVALTVTDGSRQVEIVELPVRGELYEVVLDDEGSRTAARQAQQMLASLTVS
jgi:membrane protease YdiL (CAAX protease family)